MEGLNITKCPNLYIKHEDYAEILLQNKKGEIIASAGAIGVSRYGNGEYRGCNSKFSYLLED